MYSERLLDHFQNPRNAGDLDGADVSAQLENPACGDVLRLSANIRDGCVVEIRFKAKGCVASMACGSAITELVTGTTAAEAGAIGREQLIAAVGGLPEASNHAAQLAVDTLRALLKNVR